LERTGGKMGYQGRKRGNTQQNNPRATKTTNPSLIKKEEVVTAFIKAYLDEREKRQRWVNILIILIFILQVSIGAITFSVILDIQKSNAEFMEYKRKATEQMLNDYSRQVKEYDGLLRESQKK
jgi:hypothetical protein